MKAEYPARWGIPQFVCQKLEKPSWASLYLDRTTEPLMLIFGVSGKLCHFGVKLLGTCLVEKKPSDDFDDWSK